MTRNEESMEVLFMHERLEDFLKVEARLVEERILLDADDFGSTHPCHLVNYHLGQGEFSCLLDRNIVSALIALVRGARVHADRRGDLLRLVAGLQAFLNAARVTSDPGLAYNEYMDHSGIDRADREYALFRGADNLNPNIYLDIALGLRDCIKPEEVPAFSEGQLRDVPRPPKLKYFERNIITLKKSLILKADGLSDYDVMLRLTDWLFEHYMFSAPTFMFLSVYFSSRRMSGMVKSLRSQDIRNATWDLCFLQHWAALKRDQRETIWLAATRDKALRHVAELMFVRADESDDEYLARMDREFAGMWSARQGRGAKLLEKLLDYTRRLDDPVRRINQPDQAHYILTLSNEVHAEFESRIGDG